MSTPELPYAGTSGWSGSDTSKERALTQDSDGTTKATQDKVLECLYLAKERGCTVAELRRALGEHHGKVSSALSDLHKTGRIARLATERRERCAVYTSLSGVEGRETAPHGRKDPVKAALHEWLTKDDHGWSPAAKDPVAFFKAMRDVTGIE